MANGHSDKSSFSARERISDNPVILLGKLQSRTEEIMKLCQIIEVIDRDPFPHWFFAIGGEA